MCNKYSNIARQKRKTEEKKKQKEKKEEKTLNSPNMMPFFTGPLPVQCFGSRFFRKLGTYSTTDALSARTLLTENICESVQQILQHSPAEKKNRRKEKKKEKQEKTLNSPNMMPFFTGPLPVQCGGGRRLGSLADATEDCSTSEDFSPTTVLTKNICRCGHHILQHLRQQCPF